MLHCYPLFQKRESFYKWISGRNQTSQLLLHFKPPKPLFRIMGSVVVFFKTKSACSSTRVVEGYSGLVHIINNCTLQNNYYKMIKCNTRYFKYVNTDPTSIMYT